MNVVKIKEAVIDAKELDRINKLLEEDIKYRSVLENVFKQLKNNGVKLDIDIEALNNNDFNVVTIDIIHFENRPRLTIAKRERR